MYKQMAEKIARFTIGTGGGNKVPSETAQFVFRFDFSRDGTGGVRGM